MSSIVDNPFVFVDPAERATTKEKAKAFEWLRSVALKDIGSPESESAAIMMHEVIRLNSAQGIPTPPHIPTEATYDARVRRGDQARGGVVARSPLAATLSRPEARMTVPGEAGETPPVSMPDGSVPIDNPTIGREE